MLEDYAILVCFAVLVAIVCFQWQFILGLAEDLQFQVLQDYINIFLYSYSGICLHSSHGIQRSVCVEFSKRFHASAPSDVHILKRTQLPLSLVLAF